VDSPRDLAAVFGIVRRFVYFALGVALIVDAVVQRGSNVAELTSALILLGLIPVDLVAARAGRRR
jgi:hypothetical protein